MSDNGRDNKPVPYHHPVRGFDHETYQRALELMEETGNVARAWRRDLRAELAPLDKPVPSAHDTLWLWAKKQDDLITRIRADKREEIIAISGEVAIATAEGFLETYSDLYPYQRALVYGIAMDKRTNWESAGKKANMLNVQFNLVTRGQEPDAIEGELVEPSEDGRDDSGGVPVPTG